MPNAHDQLAQLINEYAAPILKCSGFTRRGRRWGKRVRDGWLVVDLQKSQWSSRNEISFTFNFGFQSELISRLIKRPFSENEPPSVIRCDLALRPPDLKPGRTDWWEVTNNADPAVGRAVKRALAARMPIFERRVSTNKRLLAWHKELGFIHSGWRASSALILALRGRKAFRSHAEMILDCTAPADRRTVRATLLAIENRFNQL